MRLIDHEEIFSSTQQGLDIFKYYFPSQDFSNPRSYFKIRPSEKTASAKVSYYKNLWRITDFGNNAPGQVNSLNAIDFVMWHENLNYYNALLFIEQVILKRNLTRSSFAANKFTAIYEQREMLPSDTVGEYCFYPKSEPSSSDLSSIGRFITKSVLTHFNCVSLDYYTYCGPSKNKSGHVVHSFKSTETYPIFLFDFNSFKIIYKPLEESKQFRFSYTGTKPPNFVFGLSQLLRTKSEFEASEEIIPTNLSEKKTAIVNDLFRCSGISDALNLHSLGFHVYWLSSESNILDFDTYKLLDDLCLNHYQILDRDKTGQIHAYKNALKFIDLLTIELPHWLANKTDWRGNQCKDLKDFIAYAGDSIEKTTYSFLVLKRSALRVRFWDKFTDPKTKKASLSFNMQYFFFFLTVNGFNLINTIYHKKAGYSYVRLVNNIAHLIHPDDIQRLVKRFTYEWISNLNRLDKLDILNKVTSSKQLSESSLESIKTISLNFINYSQDVEFLHFNNLTLKITPTSFDTIRHDSLPNPILGSITVNTREISHLIKKDFWLLRSQPITVDYSPEYSNLLSLFNNCQPNEKESLSTELAQFPELDKYSVVINDSDFIFTQFLIDLSRIHWRKEEYDKLPLSPLEIKEQNLALANIMFVLGYHCTQHKDPGKPWLTFLQDNTISDIGLASGRTGKSSLSQSITFVRSSFYKGGRSLNDQSSFQFFYDGLTEFHDYIEIDDLHEYADFNWFLTQVTGKREVNPKHYSPFVLDYYNSGKMLISSNFELHNVDSSTIGRILSCSISDYYHEKTKFNSYRESRSPLTKFGRRLYDDFTHDEWIRFYNFMAYCIQLNMRFHKINPPSGNILKRQLRRLMAQGLGREEEFFRWANDYFIPKPSNFHDLYSPPECGYLNTLIIKDVAFDNFKTTLTNKQRNEYKSSKFKKHLESWCEYYSFELNPIALCTDPDNRRILKSMGGKTSELVFINSIPSSFSQSDSSSLASDSNVALLASVFSDDDPTAAPF